MQKVGYSEEMRTHTHCENSECLLYRHLVHIVPVDEWNNRPIEDKLQIRVRELERALRNIESTANEATGLTRESRISIGIIATIARKAL